MRRLFVLLAGVGLISTSMGCCCTCIRGKCDCVPPIQPCCIYGLYPPAAGMPVLPATPSASTPTTTQAGAEVPADPAPPTPQPNPPMPAKEQIGLPREL
jgi:hypothetical protein